MRKVAASLIVLAVVLTACLPRFGNSDEVSVSAQRVGSDVVATLVISVPASEVQFIWDDGVTSHADVRGDLAPGTYASTYTGEKLSCAVSGYTPGPRYFFIPC